MRLPAVTAFAQWMRKWVDRPHDWNHNLKSWTTRCRHRPPGRHGANQVPWTIFDDSGADHFYDQVAWFLKAEGTSLLKASLRPACRLLRFIPNVMTELTCNGICWRISDHDPLRVEFPLSGK